MERSGFWSCDAWLIENSHILHNAFCNEGLLDGYFVALERFFDGIEMGLEVFPAGFR